MINLLGSSGFQTDHFKKKNFLRPFYKCVFICADHENLALMVTNFQSHSTSLRLLRTQPPLGRVGFKQVSKKGCLKFFSRTGESNNRVLMNNFFENLFKCKGCWSLNGCLQNSSEVTTRLNRHFYMEKPAWVLREMTQRTNPKQSPKRVKRPNSKHV